MHACPTHTEVFSDLQIIRAEINRAPFKSTHKILVLQLWGRPALLCSLAALARPMLCAACPAATGTGTVASRRSTAEGLCMHASHTTAVCDLGRGRHGPGRPALLCCAAAACACRPSSADALRGLPVDVAPLLSTKPAEMHARCIAPHTAPTFVLTGSGQTCSAVQPQPTLAALARPMLCAACPAATGTGAVASRWSTAEGLCMHASHTAAVCDLGWSRHGRGKPALLCSCSLRLPP